MAHKSNSCGSIACNENSRGAAATQRESRITQLERELASPKLILPEVLAMTRWSRSTLYNRIKSGVLKRGARFGGGKKVTWSEAEIRSIMAAGLAERDDRTARALAEQEAVATGRTALPVAKTGS
jgi:predicted DNA-binding transcriptional regulator AlpA